VEISKGKSAILAYFVATSNADNFVF
jgi:hypothetical protein